ncbi:SDR family oxidoreductase [Aliarcobacter butzleri]|uniref:SDR family NAD(P)-dependent oxidoreductase n=1 Tax=Aliarcobacter butzleri TaxID=28197 RepID=UPI001EDAF186|nr:SDR family oxidoreductase [Aliarcobacter butzleri]MCG3711712.1 SDR family oxidoreductase [Aliarcobacter butzleri]MCG3714096.1 SDR family oxidoreductase [Aliarcobacter butzleri]
MISFNENNLFLVTGASSGLGKATLLELNKLGAKVIGVGRNIASLNDVKNNSSFPENIHLEIFDLDKTEEIATFFKNIVKKYGKLNGIAHFAGISKLYPLRTTSLDILKEIFELNFFSSYEIVRVMNDKRFKNSEEFSIVLISSISAIRSFEGLSAYGMSKGAINSLVVSSALELAKNKVRINSILPGHIETNMTNTLSELQSEEYKKELLNSYPLGEGIPEDIAKLTTFLLSNSSKWITGQNIVIDGGRTLL